MQTQDPHTARVRQELNRLQHQPSTLPTPGKAFSQNAIKALLNRHFSEMLGLTGRGLFQVREANHFIHEGQYLAYFAVIRQLCAFGGKDLFAKRGQVIALANIALFYQHRIREIDDWDPGQSKPKQWVDSLIAHLFAAYPTPDFLLQLWYTKRRAQIRDWYLYAAKGGSMRGLPNAPMYITRKMAHNLRQVPRYISQSSQAFRWAQLKAMGAPEPLIHSVLGSFLATDMSQEAFWTPILEFFNHNYVAEQFMDIAGILDYIQNVYGSTEAGRKQFHTRGRTLQSLNAATQRWHLEITARNQGFHLKWKPQKVADFELELPGSKKAPARRLRLVQLSNGKDLAMEGALMHHCVATYGHACVEGTTSIWSLRELQKGKAPQSLVTIEMRNADRTLVQIRARFNAKPEQVEVEVIKKWAAQAQLSISPYAI